jgi:hypothetical protein
MKTAIEFIATENLNGKDIQMKGSFAFNYSGYGWYQIYDTKTKGQDWYAEGRLIMNQISLVSFSGFDELPICILNKLKELGYNTSQVNKLK